MMRVHPSALGFSMGDLLHLDPKIPTNPPTPPDVGVAYFLLWRMKPSVGMEHLFVAAPFGIAAGQSEADAIRNLGSAPIPVLRTLIDQLQWVDLSVHIVVLLLVECGEVIKQSCVHAEIGIKCGALGSGLAA